MAIFNIMYTDGYIQLVDKHLRETPISTTPFPNYINSCSDNTPTDKSGVIRKVPNTVDVPMFSSHAYFHKHHHLFDFSFRLFTSSQLYIFLSSPYSDDSKPYGSSSFLSNNLSHSAISQKILCYPHDGIIKVTKESQQTFLSLISNTINTYSLNDIKIPMNDRQVNCHVSITETVRSGNLVSYAEYSICILSWIGFYLGYVCCCARFAKNELCSVCSFVNTLKCSLESYVCSIQQEMSCFIDNIKFSTMCYLPEGVEYGCYITDLKISVNSCQSELISAIETKIQYLKCIRFQTGELTKIISYMESLCFFINSDISELCEMVSKRPQSISSYTILKYHIKKYSDESKSIYSNIRDFIRCIRFHLKYLQSIKVEIRNLILEIKSRIEFCVSSIEINIEEFNRCIKCDIEEIDISFKCEIPEPSDIKCKEKLLSSRIMEAAKAFKTVVCCMELTILYLRYIDNNLKNSLGPTFSSFFECSKESILLELKKTYNSPLMHLSSKISDQGPKHSFLDPKKDNTYLYNFIFLSLSHMNLLENRLVISMSLDYWTRSEIITKILKSIIYCPCAENFEKMHVKDRPDGFTHSIHDLMKKIENPHLEFKEDNVFKNQGNHLCLCLIVKYHSRPALLRCLCYIRDMELDILSTTCRIFDKYTSITSFSIDISRLLFFVLDVIIKITKWIDNVYGSKYRRLCLCTFSEYHYHVYFINVMIYVSLLLDKAFTFDNQTIQGSIQCLSNILSEFYYFDWYFRKLKQRKEKDKNEEEKKQKPGYATLNISQTMSGIVITNDMLILTLGHSKNDAKMLINETMNEFFGTIKYVISTVAIKGSAFNLFYDNFSALSFNMIQKGLVDVGGSRSIINMNSFLSNQYILRVRNSRSNGKLCQIYKAGKLFNISCKSKILCISLSLAREKYNLISSQVTKCSIVRFLDGHSPDIYRIAGDINRNTINTTEIIIKTSKNTRITEATQKMVVPDKHEESGGSNNNYTYNDAYRINTSRAHGSLKYIIIKIVLILIIVVMTIFMSEIFAFIISKQSIICKMFNPSLYEMSPIERKLALLE